MKKFGIFVFLAAAVFCFVSFSLFSPDSQQTTTVEFKLSKDFISSAVSSSRSLQNGGNGTADSDARPITEDVEVLPIKFCLALKGDYNKEIVKYFLPEALESLESEEVTFTFDAVPVGSKVKAVAAIYKPDSEIYYVDVKGESEYKEIKSGDNFIDLPLITALYTLKVNAYLQVEPGTPECILYGGKYYVRSEEESKTEEEIEYLRVSDVVGSIYLGWEEKFEENASKFITLDGRYYKFPPSPEPCLPEFDENYEAVTYNYYFDSIDTVSAGGNISIDGNALTIQTSDISAGLYRNSDSITFAAVDSLGESVSGVTYDAKLLHKGIDMSDYYGTVEENTFPILLETIPAGNYQLFVTAKYNEVTSSQTFDLVIYNSYLVDVSDNVSSLPAGITNVVITGNASATSSTYRSGNFLFDFIYKYKTTLTSITFNDEIELGNVSSTTAYFSMSSTKLTNTISFRFNKKATIGEYALYGCTIDSLVFTTADSTIGNGAVGGGSSTKLKLGSVDLTGVKTIGSWAFQDRSGLSELVIPESVTSIGASAFSDTDDLTSVVFEVTEGWKKSDGTSIDVTDSEANATNLKASSGGWGVISRE